MEGVERRVLGSIDSEGMLDYLCELISVPSHGGRETAAQMNVKAKLEALGLDVDTWMIDFEGLRGHPSFSMSLERGEGVGVVGSTGGEGRSLMLNGHIDTVAPGEEGNWSYPPLEGTVVDGRVYGRGACDMKGGLCCAIYAAKAIRDAGLRPKGRLMIASTIGEEDGGVGALATVLRGYGADAAVVMEPSGLHLAPAHAGALSFMVSIIGRSAHACVREEGVSAIEKFVPVFEALRRLEEERNSGLEDPLYSGYRIPYAINVGKMRGGEWPGSVPESLVFEGRIGVAVGEAVDEARRSLEEAVAGASEADPWLRGHPPRVEWRGYQFEPSSIPQDHPIMETVRGAYGDATGRAPITSGMTYASDMRHLVNVGGTPTMIFGPGDVRNAHCPDEYVEVEDLIAATRILALTILRFCGYEEC